MSHDSNLIPTNASCWTGRRDTAPGERFFQRVTCTTLALLPQNTNPHHFVLVGFATDEGILRNEGRQGAALAPDAIREAFGRLACHTDVQIFDIGNVSCQNHELEQASCAFASVIKSAQAKGYKTIVLGGGHEVAYGHFLGLASKDKTWGILNLDAHFDLRTPKDEMLTSGTPFTQIADFQAQNNAAFHYGVMGIQPQANTQSLYQKAQALGATYKEAKALIEDGLEKNEQWIRAFSDKVDALYLTLCMDVFAQHLAPGVSAPQPLGLYPFQVLPLLDAIMASKKVMSIDIVEVSPPWDELQKTVKLAAELLAFMIERFVMFSKS